MIRVGFLVLALGSCGSLCTQTPAGGVRDATPAEAKAACAKLASFGCAEGRDSECVVTIEESATAGETRREAVACVGAAAVLSAALACDPGFFSCTREGGP